MTPEQEREAFEAWVLKDLLDAPVHTSATDKQWRAWQARASLAQPASVPDLYERLAEAHDASLDDDHRACRVILTEVMSLLAAAPAAPQPAQADAPHLFELWWERFMPAATQAEAWAAWQAAPRADGVGVAAPQPEEQPHSVPAKTLIAMAEAWEMNAAESRDHGWHTQADAFTTCAADARRAVKLAAPSAQAEPTDAEAEQMIDELGKHHAAVARITELGYVWDRGAWRWQAEPTKCISTNPNAQRPYRPDDFCADPACGLLGQCSRAWKAEQGGK